MANLLKEDLNLPKKHSIKPLLPHRDNDEMKKLYCDKVSQGKAKKEALVIVARKLAAIILAIYKNNTPYNPARVFNQNT